MPRNQHLFKCNDEVKQLVNLGLSACNCSFHIKFKKGHVGSDVTGQKIKLYVKNLIIRSQYDITLAVDIRLQDKEKYQVCYWVYGQIIYFEKEEEKKKKSWKKRKRKRDLLVVLRSKIIIVAALPNYQLVEDFTTLKKFCTRGVRLVGSSRKQAG